MRICFVAKIFLPFIGGDVVVIYEVARRLVRLGHEVDVLTARIADEPAEEEIEGMRIHRFKMPFSAANERLGRPAFLLYSAFQLPRFLRRHPVDLVHENVAPNPSFAPLVARRHGVPFAATLHDIPDWGALGYSLPVSFLNSRQTRLFFARMPYDNVISVAGSTRAKLRAIRPRGNHAVILNGADPERYDRVEAEGKFSRPTVIYVGRFSLNKRVDWLLDATAELKASHPDIRALIVGTGAPALRERLERQVEELGLIDNVEFAGRVPEERKIELLKRSHVLALPSTTEGCPLVLLEAMACGLPFVASNVGGIAELESGRVVDGQGPAFAAALGELLADRVAMERIGLEGRRRVERELNWDSVTRSYLDYWESLTSS